MMERLEADEALKHVKYQQYESKAFQKLQDEYVNLLAKMQKNSSPTFTADQPQSSL